MSIAVGVSYTGVAQADFAALGHTPGGPITRQWLRMLTDVDARAKRKLSGDYANVRTGNLRSSQQPPFITYEAGRIVGIVQNIARYAYWVHEGTRPHEINARNVRFLTGWTYQGAPVFTPHVVHPGTRPRPWLRDSLREAIAAHA